MIHPEIRSPMPWPPRISGGEDCELLDRALNELMNEDQWVNDFIKRLNSPVEDIVHKP